MKKEVKCLLFLYKILQNTMIAMTNKEIIDTFNSIKDPLKQPELLYMVLEGLNIPFTKTSCSKCLNDYYNIVQEELGFIESAAELSDFDRYEYIHHRAIIWKNKKISKLSSQECLRWFVNNCSAWRSFVKKV